MDVEVTFMNIGNVRQQPGDHESALLEYQKALGIQIKSLGVSVAQTYVNNGNVHEMQGDYEKALFHHQISLEIFKKSLGDSHVSVATTTLEKYLILISEPCHSYASLRACQVCEKIFKSSMLGGSTGSSPRPDQTDRPKVALTGYARASR